MTLNQKGKPYTKTLGLLNVLLLGLLPGCGVEEAREAGDLQGLVRFEQQPVAEARLELKDPTSQEVISQGITADDGTFRLPANGLEQAVLSVSLDDRVLYSGAVSNHQTLELDLASLPAAQEEDGEVRAQFLPPQLLCSVGVWVDTHLEMRGQPDARRHCVASCRSARTCLSPSAAFSVGVLKESVDAACRYGSSNLKNKLRSVSACSGWSSADMDANRRGLGYAFRFWKSCNKWCG